MAGKEDNLDFIGAALLLALGLMGGYVLRGRRKPSPSRVLILRAERFARDLDGGRTIYRSGEQRISTRALTDREIAAEVREWEPIEVLTSEGSLNDAELRRIRIHEAGHVVVAMRTRPMQEIYYLIGAPHRNRRTGDHVQGKLRHAPDLTDCSEGVLLDAIMLSYGGLAAEGLLGCADHEVGFADDVQSAFVTAYTIVSFSGTRMHHRTLPWSALGIMHAQERDDALIARAREVCQEGREATLVLLRQERAVLEEIIIALERRPILTRFELYALWFKHHPDWQDPGDSEGNDVPTSPGV